MPLSMDCSNCSRVSSSALRKVRLGGVRLRAEVDQALVVGALLPGVLVDVARPARLPRGEQLELQLARGVLLLFVQAALAGGEGVVAHPLVQGIPGLRVVLRLRTEPRLPLVLRRRLVEAGLVEALRGVGHPHLRIFGNGHGVAGHGLRREPAAIRGRKLGLLDGRGPHAELRVECLPRKLLALLGVLLPLFVAVVSAAAHVMLLGVLVFVQTPR
jgi:hypothetical protein